MRNELTDDEFSYEREKEVCNDEFNYEYENAEFNKVDVEYLEHEYESCDFDQFEQS